MWIGIIMSMATILLADITSVRSTYKQAVNSGSKADELVKLCEPRKNDALFLAYYGTGKALQAKHGWNPATRLSLAKKAAADLNKAVAAVPTNLEIRFLRFSFEAKAPSVLGITLHTAEDKKWILSHLDRNHAMWDVIKTFLSGCDLLTKEEKNKVSSL